MWLLIYTLSLNVCYHIMYVSPVKVTYTSDIALVLDRAFLDIQAIIEFGFNLNHVRDMIKTYSQLYRTDKYSQHNSIIWSVWEDGWVFVYKRSCCRFQSHCSHLSLFVKQKFSQVLHDKKIQRNTEAYFWSCRTSAMDLLSKVLSNMIVRVVNNLLSYPIY